jgi:hypothetical protein
MSFYTTACAVPCLSHSHSGVSISEAVVVDSVRSWGGIYAHS